MNKKHSVRILHETEQVSFQNKAKALLDAGYEMSGFNCCAGYDTHYYAIFVKDSFMEDLRKEHEDLQKEIFEATKKSG